MKRILASLIFLLVFSLGFSAVTFDAQSSGSGTATTNITWSHTCTGSNLILVVEVVTNAASDTVTGVTYNAVAMTSAGAATLNTGVTSRIFYLANPATGAHTVSVTASGSAAIGGMSQSFTGAAGTVNGRVVTTGSATTASLTVTSTSGDMVVDSFGQVSSLGGTTSNQTNRSSTTAGINLAGDASTAAGSASVSMQYTGIPAATAWAYQAINVQQLAAPVASGTGNLSLLGVGRSYRGLFVSPG